MRRLLPFCLALLLASSAFAYGPTDWSELQSSTRATPTLVTEGIELLYVTGYRVLLCAAEGETLSGTGSVTTWYYSPTLFRWMLVPLLTQVLPASTAGQTCIGVYDAQTVTRRGRLLVATDGVGVSGGQLTVVIETSRE